MTALTCHISAQGVARVEMKRPHVFNAVDETMIAELNATFSRLGSDPSGKLLKMFGAGMFVSPHKLTVDQDGNLWMADNGAHQVL